MANYWDPASILRKRSMAGMSIPSEKVMTGNTCEFLDTQAELHTLQTHL